MNDEVPKDTVLLSTKLKMPQARRGYIVREELFKLLERCASVSVIYIKGAAGTGKTTLVSSFIKKTGLKNTAWLTIDETDDNIFSFWHYFAAACRDFLGAEYQNILSLLRSNFDASKIKNILCMMINGLCGDEDYYLVLDDMQFIKDGTLLNTIGYFVKAMPENFHLFMLSREDPAVYLGELAVSGSLIFIDGEKLRFTPQEGMRFLKETLKLKNSDGELLKMNDFAEGWIGGLQLVAAAGGAQNGLLHNAGSTITTDYLSREIFKKLTDEERQFLTTTGILPYFDEEICSVVAQGTDFKKMMAALDAKNLFIICIDEENGIYRYHNILSEYLKQQFSYLDKEKKTKYRRKAAQALEGKGDLTAAFYQLLKIEDYDDAMRVLKRMDETIEAWALIDKLPLCCISHDINFLIQCLMYNVGVLNMTRVKELFKMLSDRTETIRSLRVNVEYARSLMNNGNKIAVTHLTPLSIEEIEKSNFTPVTEAVLLFENSNLLLEQKECEKALVYAERALQVCGESNIFVRYYSLQTKAQILEETGSLNESLEIYKGFQNIIQSSSSIFNMFGYNYYMSVAGVYHKRMDEENSKKALSHLKGIIDSANETIDILDAGYDYHLAEHELLFGNEKHGALIIEELLNKYANDNIRQFERIVYTLYMKKLLPENDCRRFAVTVEKDGLENVLLLAVLFYARIIWDAKEQKKARAIVEDVLSFSRAHKNKLHLIEADLLKIRMLLSEKDADLRLAKDLLKEAVYYAFENYIMEPFFLEKDAVVPLLTKILKEEKQDLNNGERRFAGDVLDICSGKKPSGSKDALSTRELEVLAEISKGLTNPEIADKLCISLATVKTHIVNIYTKLGVSSRIAAIKKAKAEKIID